MTTTIDTKDFSHLSVKELQVLRGHDGLHRYLYDQVLVGLPVYIYVLHFYGTESYLSDYSNDINEEPFYDIHTIITLGYFNQPVINREQFQFASNITIDWDQTKIIKCPLFDVDTPINLSSIRLPILEGLIVPQNTVNVITGSLSSDIQAPIEVQITRQELSLLDQQSETFHMVDVLTQEIIYLPILRPQYEISAMIFMGKISPTLTDFDTHPLITAHLQTITPFELYSGLW
jgi:hypothetical protein